MPANKLKTYSRLKTFGVFMLGALMVSALWMINFYNQIEYITNGSLVIDAKTAQDEVPSLEEMTARRGQFTHNQIHLHLNQRGIEIVSQELLALGITPDAGTLELIDTIGERYNKTSLIVVNDLKHIAAGHYKDASKYGVIMERRLVGETGEGTKDKPLAMNNVRYEIVQTWNDDRSATWKIGQEIFNFDDVPKRRNLPDNPRIAVQSFLDVMPSVLKTNKPARTASNEEHIGDSSHPKQQTLQ